MGSWIVVWNHSEKHICHFVTHPPQLWVAFPEKKVTVELSFFGLLLKMAHLRPADGHGLPVLNMATKTHRQENLGHFIDLGEPLVLKHLGEGRCSIMEI